MEEKQEMIMKLNEKNVELIYQIKNGIDQGQQQINIVFITACNEAKLDPMKHKLSDDLKEIVKK